MAKEIEQKTERPEFLRDCDAAKFLNMSVFTLRNWRNFGVGPRYRKFERSVRYAVSDLVEYANGRKV